MEVLKNSKIKQALKGKSVEYIYNLSYIVKKQKLSVKDTLELIKKPDREVLFNRVEFASIAQQQEERDEYLCSPPKLEEGLFKCSACGSKKTYSYGKQTRSADEATTVFVTCGNCGKKWIINS